MFLKKRVAEVGGVFSRSARSSGRWLLLLASRTAVEGVFGYVRLGRRVQCEVEVGRQSDCWLF